VNRILFMLAALASSALPVSAQAQTLALLEPDGELADAVRTALEPWGTEVRIVPATEARGAARGAAAAETTGAVVVCWIEGAELWIYDARTGSAIARPVTPPPHDAAAAASVALSLKTWLRRTAIDPAHSPPVARERPAAQPAAPAAASPEPMLVVGLRIGPRLWATSPDLAELRAGLTGALFFLDDHLGVGLELSSGLGVGFDAPTGRGRWVETALALTVELRADPLRWLDLGIRLGASAGLGWLGATLRQPDRGAEVARFLPALLADVSVGLWPTDRVRLAVAVGVDGFLLRQRYRVRGEPLLDVAPAAPRASLVVELVP